MPKKIVSVKKIKDSATIPDYHSSGASGFDLASAESKVIPPDCWVTVGTGLAFGIPSGYEIQVRPRSGRSAKSGYILKNTIGTIDSDYTGEVKVVIHNLGEDTIYINEGDRIAQGVLAPVVRAEFFETDNLKETGRGSRGFGSTGG